MDSVLAVRDKDTSENNYHYFLAAVFAMTSLPGWKAISQDQGRKGYSDFALIGRENQAIIIEEKVAKTIDEMEGLYEKGNMQIEKNAYAEKYGRLGYDLFRYVIVYYEMRAYIRKC